MSEQRWSVRESPTLFLLEEGGRAIQDEVVDHDGKVIATVHDWGPEGRRIAYLMEDAWRPSTIETRP